MLVPKLRFKEFNNEWKTFKIQDTFDNISIKNCPNMTILTIIQGHGTIPRNQSNRNIIFDEEKSRTYKMVNKKDFIIHLRSFEGGLEMSNHNGIVSPAYTIIRGKDIVIPLFFKYYFRTNKFINSILSKSVEGIRDGKQISYNQLKDFYIPVPTLEEQTKIANFLSLIDRKIELQEKLVENLNLYKKGLLKKVFSNNLGWKSAKLGDLFEISASGDISKDRVSNVKTNTFKYPVYSNSLIDNGLFGYTDTYKIDGNTITVTGRGDIGFAIPRFEKYYPIVRLLVLKSNNMNNVFFANLINYTKIIIESTGVPQLTAPQLKSVLVKYPSIEEQNRIANLFTSLDKKIELETKKLQDLKTYKKGLLQKMFI